MDQLVPIGTILESVTNVTLLPTTESQARPLTTIDRAQVGDAVGDIAKHCVGLVPQTQQEQWT